MTPRELVKGLLPPVLLGLAKRLRGRAPAISWTGSYPSWTAAAAECTAYDSAEIFQRVLAATRKVVAGEAVYERDSFLFAEIEYAWPLLASLLQVHAETGSLRLIDFGGSLGSTYRQNQRFLDRLQHVQWTVVEQGHFVDAGKAEFETGRLQFRHRMAEVESPDAVLFASSLCYLEDPWHFLQEAMATSARFLLIERTPFSDELADRICVQTVRPPIYVASYPCRVFSRPKFESWMASQDWNLVESWVPDLQPDPASQYRGYLYRRK